MRDANRDISEYPRFQFPSNGKVDSERRIRLENFIVFGFNSLQTGKWIQSILMGSIRDGLASSRFNSLQTGKWIQSLSIFLKKRIEKGFNSLQTGKWIQSRRYSQYSQGSRNYVSIPFKRESGFRERFILRI